MHVDTDKHDTGEIAQSAELQQGFMPSRRSAVRDPVFPCQLVLTFATLDVSLASSNQHSLCCVRHLQSHKWIRMSLSVQGIHAMSGDGRHPVDK